MPQLPKKYVPVNPTDENYRLAHPSDDLPMPVGPMPFAGVSTKWSRADHVHVGVAGGVGMSKPCPGEVIIAGYGSAYCDCADIVFGKTSMTREIMKSLSRYATQSFSQQDGTNYLQVTFKWDKEKFDGDIAEFQNCVVYLPTIYICTNLPSSPNLHGSYTDVRKPTSNPSDPYAIWVDSDGYFNMKWTMQYSAPGGTTDFSPYHVDVRGMDFFLDKAAEINAKLDEVYGGPRANNGEQINMEYSKASTLWISGRCRIYNTEPLHFPAHVCGLESTLPYPFTQYTGLYEQSPLFGYSSIDFATTTDYNDSWDQRIQTQAIDWDVNVDPNNRYDITIENLGLYRSMSYIASTEAKWWGMDNQYGFKMKNIQFWCWGNNLFNYSGNEQGSEFRVFNCDFDDQPFFVNKIYLYDCPYHSYFQFFSQQNQRAYAYIQGGIDSQFTFSYGGNDCYWQIQVIGAVNGYINVYGSGNSSSIVNLLGCKNLGISMGSYVDVIMRECIYNSEIKLYLSDHSMTAAYTFIKCLFSWLYNYMRVVVFEDCVYERFDNYAFGPGIDTTGLKKLRTMDSTSTDNYNDLLISNILITGKSVTSTDTQLNVSMGNWSYKSFSKIAGGSKLITASRNTYNVVSANSNDIIVVSGTAAYSELSNGQVVAAICFQQAEGQTDEVRTKRLTLYNDGGN